MIADTLLAPLRTAARRLSPRRLYRDAWAVAYANPLYRLSLAGRGPTGLERLPAEPWPGDAARGKAILEGAFAVDGHRVHLDEAAWLGGGPDETVGTALHEFGWLRDLRAAGGDAAGARARELAAYWLEGESRCGALPWRADVMGARLAHWLAAWPFLCPDPGTPFAARLLRSASRQARHLGRAVASAEPGARTIGALKGLIYGALALPGHDDALAPALARLEAEIGRQVLPDGGHVERSPSRHLAVLRDLVDLRAALEGARQPMPAALQTAIDRMTPMLRTFRHGDGGLALFNDSVEEDPGHVDMVLTRAAVRGSPLTGAPHSGFCRLASGPVLLIGDVGAPAPAGFNGHAHAGCLSFELSVRKERLIVNCGCHRGHDAEWREALRATAAHSTLSVDNTNSAELRAGGGVGRRHPLRVLCTRREAEGETWIDSSHDGYRRGLGLTHSRELYLSAKGDDLRGSDTLSGKGGHEFALRFHLHPAVTASLVEGGKSVELRLRGGGVWRFRARGGPLRLEDSVYFGNPGRVRHSRQIVVYGLLDGHGATVHWALRQEDGSG